MTEPDQTLEGRLEFDFADIDKNEWGQGDWLNEPDKVQCMKEGYHCLVVRALHGALCGYIGVTASHPCFGLDGEGIDSLISEIMHADFRDRLKRWGKRGRPLDVRGVPEMGPISDRPEPIPQTPAAYALRDNIDVHGGITWAAANEIVTEAHWARVKRDFPKARETAKRYPLGDAARWLHKWADAEHSFEGFKRVFEQTCICWIGPTPELGLWWFGFDCAHAGDLSPATEAVLRNISTLSQNKKRAYIMRRDVYRNLAYVENECLNLARQLKAIADSNPKASPKGKAP